MDYVKARIAPFVNMPFLITAATGEYPSGGAHTGLDLATSNGNDPLYSLVNGTVIINNYDSSYGNYIVVQDDITGITFLYAHMESKSSYEVGSKVTTSTIIGIEGATGNVTGPHVHVEQQNLEVGEMWHYGIPASEQIHASEYMGIPNVAGTWCIYDEDIPPFVSSIKRKKFPWVIYTHKLRND